MKNSKSLTDWERVKSFREGDRIPYNPEDGPYDPNDEAATGEWLSQAIILRPGQRGPQKAPTKMQISLRLSPEVIEHFKATGKGWQTRIDETLKKAIEPKRRKRAS
ncbi:MAG TPA: BrnA antitoxin family protein [Acidobacteriaceae bacterium]|nr:BrnA antitoxin family protein [Acidobacteriaceae bacterium]